MSTPLNDAESNAFDYIVALVNDQIQGQTVALVRSTMNGRDVALLSAVSELEDGGARVSPLAIIVDDQFFSELSEP